MTRIEQIERKRLYGKLQDELVNIVSGALECAPMMSEEEAGRIVNLGEEVNACINRYILSNELIQATDNDDSAIALTRRVVASLGMTHKLEGRKLDYEQSCQIMLSIVTSLKDQQRQLKETLKQVNKDYNVQQDWYIDSNLRKRAYVRPLAEEKTQERNQ